MELGQADESLFPVVIAVVRSLCYCGDMRNLPKLEAHERIRWTHKVARDGPQQPGTLRAVPGDGTRPKSKDPAISLPAVRPVFLRLLGLLTA